MQAHRAQPHSVARSPSVGRPAARSRGPRSCEPLRLAEIAMLHMKHDQKPLVPRGPVESRGHSRSETPGGCGAAGHRATCRGARRARRTTPVSRRRLLIAVHLLHERAASLRARGVQSHRSGTGRTALSGDPATADQRRLERYGRRAARQSADGRESSGRSRPGGAQEQARGGGVGRVDPSSARRGGDGAEDPGSQRARGWRFTAFERTSSTDRDPNFGAAAA